MQGTHFDSSDDYTWQAGAQQELLVICDHASARIPIGYADLGLPRASRNAHICWDIGAGDLGLALGVASMRTSTGRSAVDERRAPKR